MADQHPVHRRGRQVHDAGDAGRPQPSLLAQADDLAFGGRPGAVRAALRPAGTVLQTGQTLGLVAAPPHIGPVPGHPHGVGSVSHRPTGLDALAQQESTSRGETSVTVHRKPPRECVCVVATHSPPRLHSMVDPVSNVHGHYSCAATVIAVVGTATWAPSAAKRPPPRPRPSRDWPGRRPAGPPAGPRTTRARPHGPA